ncbi:MAG: hypothetical protein HY553_17865 [Elusimicrobia bacterium]|nr:hypothetical protein [Elusimicrobiota bacterium]
MDSGKISKNKDFLLALERLFDGARPHPAPTHFADRVLDRWREEPSWTMAMPAAVVMACATLALFFALGRAPQAQPQILAFGFDRESIPLYQPVTLRWKVAHVTRVQIKVTADGAILKDMPVARPVESGELTMSMSLPGRYGFELIAHTPHGAITHRLGR